MKKIKTTDYTIKPDHKISLKKYKTAIKSLYSDDQEADQKLNEAQEAIADLQDKLYSQKDWAVLIVLQGMDTAGKDGLIKHVLKDVDPQGCSVTSFKAPTAPELAHDFLWRLHVPMARRGEIKVFNRSYYEDVIVPYVHPEILEGTSLPKKILKSKNLLKDRCADIANFEKYLFNQGILIIKIFLHLSKDEQKNRLLARIDDPDKNWKMEESDVVERGFWSTYQNAYEFCISRTSHDTAPWYVVPADDKPTARLIASKIIIERMKELKLAYPQVTAAQKKNLLKMKKRI